VPFGVPLVGAPAASRVVTGPGHACLLTSAGAAWCWGSNDNGELGNNTITQTCQGGSCSTTAMPVLGGLTFAQLAVGHDQTCGVTTAGAGYCWGSDLLGALGNGAGGSVNVPGAI